MAYYWGDYYRGDYYRGDYYRGDSWLSSLAASVGNLLPNSWTPSGARKVGFGVAGAAGALAGTLAAAPFVAAVASKAAPYLTLSRGVSVAKAATPLLASTMHRIAPNAASSTSAAPPAGLNNTIGVGVPAWLGRKKKRKKSTSSKVNSAGRAVVSDFVKRMAKARAAKKTKKTKRRKK